MGLALPVYMQDMLNDRTDDKSLASGCMGNVDNKLISLLNYSTWIQFALYCIFTDWMLKIIYYTIQLNVQVLIITLIVNGSFE